MAEGVARVASIDLPAVKWIGRRLHSAAWVRGPVWDSFWMLSALWLAPVVLWLAHGYDDPESSPLDSLYFAITALFWIGHRFCSTYLAYATEAYRPLLRTQPIRFVVLPILITLACFALFLPADSALPWTRQERVIVAAIIDYAWLTWHFASQHFGALSLYRARAGRARCQRTRTMDRIFALTVGGLLVFVADLLAGTVAYQDDWIGRLPGADVILAMEGPIRYGGTALLLVATAVVLWMELRSPEWSLPRVLYIIGLAVMVSIALQPRSLFLFLVVWTSQHWILATGLGAQTPARRASPHPRPGLARSALNELNARPWAIVILLAVISIVLLPIFEVEANRDGGTTYYGDRIFGVLAEGLRTSSWVPVLVALGFASGFVHYLLDRSIYRLSNPEVRAAAGGLLE